MRIFLSWGGEKSRQLGEVIRTWLPNVHQRVEVFFSPNDIEKGAKWDTEIEAQLKDTIFCIVCLTAEAMQSAWVNFEAGAISKGLGQSRIAGILFDLGKGDVAGPLARFQLTEFNKVDFLHLMQSLNNSLDEGRLKDSVLERAFDREWPDLQREVNAILTASPAKKPPTKPGKEIAEETLVNTREILQQITRINNRKNSAVIGALADVNNLTTRLWKLIQEENWEKTLPVIKSLGQRIDKLNATAGKIGGQSLERLRKWVKSELPKTATSSSTSDAASTDA